MNPPNISFNKDCWWSHGKTKSKIRTSERTQDCGNWSTSLKKKVCGGRDMY